MTPDRRAYVEANAVALVESLEARVAHQKAGLARLNQSLANVRADRDRLREALGQILARAVLALRDTNLAIAVVDLYQIEADAREALAASGITVGEQP